MTGGACTAEVVAAVRPWLADALAHGDPSTWPGFTTVKHSTVRTTLRGALHDPAGHPLAVHVKLYRAVRLSDRARDALGGARAAREFANLRAARARGLPAVRPLAHGVARGSFGSRSFLVTATVPESLPLARGPLRQAQAACAGSLLRTLHDAGLHAGDLHPGNLLATPEGELLLVDLTSARFAQPLDLAQRAHALAFFCLDLDGNVRDPAAAPLVAAYRASPALLARALALGRRLRRRAMLAFGRRAGRTCAHTALEHERGGVTWAWHRPAQDAHAEARAFLAALPPPLRQGRRGAVHLHEHLVAKEREAAKARALFTAHYLLEFCGVPAPQPVCVRTAGGRGVAVARRVAGEDLAARLAANTLPAGCFPRLAADLGRSLGRMHAHGLRHRDLKFENLVPDAAGQRLWIVDLEGVRPRLPLDPRGEAADLGRVLAAWRAAGGPGGRRVLAAFERAYRLALRCLNHPVPHRRHLRRSTEARARAWASAHRAPHAAAGGAG
ncbi:MAG: hypothetical protein IT458_08265 [Planctomycetes bacterium]|nr:hypothetical protein [Planctomycetota bacterium]